MDRPQLFLNFANRVDFFVHYDVLEFLIKLLLNYILTIDRVRGITHLMRDCSVDQGKQLFVGVCHVVHDLARNIDNLDHFSASTQNLPFDLEVLTWVVALRLFVILAGTRNDAKDLALQLVLIHYKQIFQRKEPFGVSQVIFNRLIDVLAGFVRFLLFVDSEDSSVENFFVNACGPKRLLGVLAIDIDLESIDVFLSGVRTIVIFLIEPLSFRNDAMYLIDNFEASLITVPDTFETFSYDGFLQVVHDAICFTVHFHLLVNLSQNLDSEKVQRQEDQILFRNQPTNIHHEQEPVFCQVLVGFLLLNVIK